MSPKIEKKMVKIYRDPDCLGATMQYRNGPIRYKFDRNRMEFEVEADHVIFVVRDCADLFRTKPKAKASKTEKTG